MASSLPIVDSERHEALLKLKRVTERGRHEAEVM
jgi:hypothetical protein